MFVKYRFATEPVLPPLEACLYEYVVAANGIFVRARRPGLEALIWVAATAQVVRGLAILEPYVRLETRVPAVCLARMFELAYRAEGREILFYLAGHPWRLAIPEQTQSGGSVAPVDPFAGGSDTLLEVHSHHRLPAYFSSTDDREERAGFRLLAVVGDLYRCPSIAVRVGIYGHYGRIPAAWVFDLPVGVTDSLYAEVNPWN